MDGYYDFDKDLVIPPKRRTISDLSQEELRAHLEGEVTCPHCKKRIARSDAVIATDYKKEQIDYHKAYLPGGWRVRRTYQTYKLNYYRCQECDNTIKRISQIEAKADIMCGRIALVVSIIAFIVFEVLCISSGEDFWVILINSVFLGGGGAFFLYFLIAILLPYAFTKKAKEIQKETGIVLHPPIPEEAHVSYVSDYE